MENGNKLQIIFIGLILCVSYIITKKVDADHYKTFYVKNFLQADRKGNIWNSKYYELQKQNYANDVKIHKEVLRENQRQNDENKKHYDESVHESQETTRMQAETSRENSSKKADSGGKQRTLRKTTKTKDVKPAKQDIVLSRKNSHQFLKRLKH